jgi:hypothetical protein
MTFQRLQTGWTLLNGSLFLRLLRLLEQLLQRLLLLCGLIDALRHILELLWVFGTDVHRLNNTNKDEMHMRSAPEHCNNTWGKLLYVEGSCCTTKAAVENIAD